jgi:pimeloyl-ACP methyl ester carboxylesterase
VILGVAAALAVDIVRIGGPAAWLAERGFVPGPGAAPYPYEALGRQVDVGGGRSVYLDCRGSGSTTVILEAGAGGGADGWGPFFDRVAGITRACAWDRPGLGRSAPRGLHTGGETAADLVAALRAAGEHGPYVVIAHSLGGMYARLFAAAEPQVKSLLLLDAYVPDLGMEADPALSPAFRAVIRTSLADGAAAFQQVEQLDSAGMMAELVRPVPVPGIVLYVDPRLRYTDPDPAVAGAEVDAWYRAMAAMYPKSPIEIVPNTSHFIQFDQPDLVLARLRTLLAEVRPT